ncbi:MAG TPA: S8 family serine peptidase, partial [Verrucomicrobiota bacterium]|nr:S8 family serine peptidase [Verrucomicrobiota bacterium]
MKSIHPTILRGVLISLLLAVPDVLQAAESESQPDFSSGISKARPASAGAAKMGVELRDLSAQFTTTRGDSPDATYTAGQLQRQFGIVSGERQPAVEVSIRTSGTVDTNALAAVGAHLWFVDGDLMLARVPVGRLQQLAALDNVKSVRATSTVEIPPLPSSRVQPQLTRTRGAADEHKLADKFDRQGLDGSGVIVGIYDTGIDWRHEDFIKPDGTTRILYLYDPYDNSWQESGGTVGSSPPFELYGLPFGTLYTASQINDALAGRGKVNSVDKVGHGTACAGIAAGNGRATANGVPAGTYQGVAHKADLICVKLKPDDSGSFVKPLPVAVGVDWILSTARKLGKPCVVSMSFGGHFSAHDGNDPQELAIDRLLETHAPGTAAVVSAGNERQDNLHAAGRFAAARQPDTYSATVELYVESFTRLTAYFNAADDWGLRITGMDSFLVDEEGRPVGGYFYRVNDSLKGLAWSRFGKHSGPIVKKWEGPFMVMPPNNFAEYFERFVDVDDASDGLHRLVIGLPPGKYLVEGYGE